MEEYDDAALHRPHDHPVIATLAGCAVLIAAALLIPYLLPVQPQMTLVAACAAAGFVLWVIGFAATTRHSTPGWKAGSLVILLAAGALAGYLAHRQYEAGGRQDPSTFAEIEFGPQNNPVVPADATSRGPISKLFAGAVLEDGKERRTFTEAMGKLGVGNLNNPYPLEQNPKVLSQCGEFAALKTMVREHAANRARRNAELLKAIEGAGLDTALREAVAAMAVPGAAARADAVEANQAATVDATVELCTMLAKRSWYNANAYFAFPTFADTDKYKALQARRAALAGEAEKIGKDAVAAMKAAQEKVRAALS